MAKYHVGVTTHRTFEVEADNKEQAEAKGRELAAHETSRYKVRTRSVSVTTEEIA